jgi:hypothetical protein
MSPDAVAADGVVEGTMIDTVIIDNRDIFDTLDPAYDAFIYRWANRLHIVTRRQVISREVLLKEGDLYSDELARETERNLRRRLSIYDAWVYPEISEDSVVVLRVVTVDQWSLLGGVTVSQEEQYSDYSIGFDEANFLGNNQTVSFYFVDPAEESSYLRAGFLDYRLWGRPFLFSTQYSGSELSNYFSVSMGRPFYELSQSLSLTGSALVFGGRADVYNDSRRVLEAEHEGEQFGLDGAYRWGGRDQKYQIVGSYTYRSQRVTDERFLGAGTQDSVLAEAGRPTDSLYHELLVGAGHSALEYRTTRGLDAFEATEDISLGYSILLSGGGAGSERGAVYHKIGIQGYAGVALGRTVLFGGLGRQIWRADGTELRRYGTVRMRLFNSSLPFVTLAMRADMAEDHRKSGANALMLGGGTGIRGYDRYYRTGDRRLVVGVESRFRPNLQILMVHLGGVLFADAGSVWKAGEPIVARGFYGTVGLGLRISFERLLRRQIIRADLAWSEGGGWQLSVGTGHYFSHKDIPFDLTSP